MVEKVSAEVIALITFIAMGMIFVIWLIGQLQEFAFFFGFRLSDVISGDLSGLITAISGISGDVIAKYVIESSKINPITYSFNFTNNLICTQSAWSKEINTTDCYPIPSIKLISSIPTSTKTINQFKIMIDKTSAYQKDNSYAKPEVKICEDLGLPRC